VGALGAWSRPVTPTLFGRIQTRIFAVIVAGGLWTLLISPLLPAGDVDLSEIYVITFTALVLLIVLGVVVWEPIYHGLQQFRWEKDWPAMFILLEGINEGLLLFPVLAWVLDRRLSVSAYLVHFITTWLVVFFFIHGPMRVPFLRWRFHGGRII